MSVKIRIPRSVAAIVVIIVVIIVVASLVANIAENVEVNVAVKAAQEMCAAGVARINLVTKVVVLRVVSVVARHKVVAPISKVENVAVKITVTAVNNRIITGSSVLHKESHKCSHNIIVQ